MTEMNAERRVCNLQPGDMFHAVNVNGGSWISLVVSVEGRKARARRITTQETAVFDLDTAVATVGLSHSLCVIDCVKPLPPELHTAMLAFDEWTRLAPSLPFRTLTLEERDAIRNVQRFYKQFSMLQPSP